MHRATPLNSSFRGYVAGGARSVVDKIDDSKLIQEMSGNFMKGETRSAVESPQNYGFTSVAHEATKDAMGRIIDGAEVAMQQKDQVGEFSVSGTITMNNIIATAVPGEYQIPQPGFPVAWGGLPGSVATQGGGDNPAWGLNFSRVGSLQGTGAFSGNSGLETRTRNTVVTACIVDG